jgi:hypothetical protein
MENKLHNGESPVTLVVPAQDAIKDVLRAWNFSKMR